MNISRRNFVSGAAAGSALLTIGFGARPAQAATQRDILVVVFQRGGCDWLQMLAPAGDTRYQQTRPTIRVQPNASQGIGTLGGTDFYISASAPELKALYDAGSLAFVHATGVPTTDRSHFTVQDMMDRGYADGEQTQSLGWLTRHMNSIKVTETLPLLSTVASSPNIPASLLGDTSALAVGNAQTFNVSGGTANAQLIRAMSTGATRYETTARATLDTITTVQQGLSAVNTAEQNAAGYTGGPMSQSLRSLAQLIRMNLGVTTATVDYGGWDTHNNLVNEFAGRTAEFSRALNAFWRDMAAYRANLTVVVMTEFGRRLQENSNQGTDHGAASGMLVLSGNVNGGKIYGTWPGLQANQLINNGDLAVTTDYRQVLAEIVSTRHGETNLSAVFPTLNYAPLGVMKPIVSSQVASTMEFKVSN